MMWASVFVGASCVPLIAGALFFYAGKNFQRDKAGPAIGIRVVQSRR
jgi:hypothetical protein